MPLYTYLITRGQKSSWNVDYSRVDDLVSDETPHPEGLLQSRIEKRTKESLNINY